MYDLLRKLVIDIVGSIVSITRIRLVHSLIYDLALCVDEIVVDILLFEEQCGVDWNLLHLSHDRRRGEEAEEVDW
jgi:hypothetical protein